MLYLGVIVLELATGGLAPTGSADLGLALEILHHGDVGSWAAAGAWMES